MKSYSNAPKYVYIRLASKKSAPAKKILLASNLPALKKSAQKLFNLNEPIAAFQDQQGDYIDDIRNIFDGNVIFAVLKSKFDGASVASSHTSNISIPLSQASSKTKENADNTQHTPKLKIQMNTNQINKQPSLVINTGNKASTPSVKINHLPNKTNPPKSSKVDKKQPKKDVQSQDDYDDCEESIEYDENDSYSEPDSFDEEPVTDGEELFKLVLPEYDEDISNTINEAFYTIIPETRTFLSNVIKNEDIHKARYFNELLLTCQKFGMFSYDENWIHLDEMQKKAKSLIKGHRIATANGYTYVMKTAILGPAKAGKSTFLNVYLRELLIDLIATDNWKNTFVFPYDINFFMEGLIDLKQFYKEYLHYIFALLKIQCPSMIPLLPSIEQCFEQITTLKGKILMPKKLTQNLEYKKLSAQIEELVSLLARIWNDPEQFEVWLGNLALLPKRLSTIFGFKQIIHVFDHFDLSNANIEPTRPFEVSEYCSFPSELLKCALIQGPFILGSKDLFTFFDSLESVDENLTVNLRSNVEVFYLWNLIDTSLYSDKEIYVEFTNTKTQLKITSYACGGIPNYLIKWNQMNEVFDKFEQLEEGTPEYEDSYCELVTLIETIVYQLFTTDSASQKKDTVENVRRRTIE
ncbi:hypothetical protein TRFO_38210 [Tritrichomonas foetus]|uniref:Doublecortin domain-containing protein n=1 Tax=Tritrichomonas foetus TaxID=1144522 RepID=A0A1J4J8Y5_9EUKA|nr:hypothetical protein TRFO_38210 [Tritrichomonas foetus]|eukprot:OHS95646.1 hypothetical protein TRFO_38210 [Tritrichomonas foetus]